MEAFSELGDRPLLGVAPGSVWATKRWTSKGFAEVIESFHNEGYAVVLIGGPGDREVGKEIEELCGISLRNLIGEVSLLVSAAIVSKLRLLVTNDSAPLHLASATGTPVVAVFCATVPEFGYGPWQVPSETVGVSGLSCRPCGRHGGNICPTGTHACQLELSSAMVIDAAKKVLARAEQSRHIEAQGAG